MPLPSHTAPAPLPRRLILLASVLCHPNKRALRTPISTGIPLWLVGIVASFALTHSLTGCTQRSVTAQPATSANSTVARIDVSALAKKEVDNPQKLCDRISELKMFPFHREEREQDAVYDEMMATGDRVVPCLIEKVTDTRPMPDFDEDFRRSAKTKIGDVAITLLVDITHLDLEPFIPDEFRHDELLYPYYAYVRKPENRKKLQEKLWDWYHRTYRPDAPLRTAQGMAFGELRQLKMGRHSSQRLEEQDGRCIYVSYGAELNSQEPEVRRLSLDLPPPCEFVRNEAGAAETFAYLEDDKQSDFWVIMVVGGPVDSTRSDQYMRTGCGTQIQAIKARYQSLTKSPIGTGITVCPSEGVREKIYRLLAKR